MSGKSKEEIAFELVSKLKGVGVWGEANISSILDMYATCLEATSGMRSVGGKKPLAIVMAEAGDKPVAARAQVQAPVQAPVQAQRPASPAQAPRQAVPTQPAAQPVVRQQQEQLQQVFQQQQVPQAR